jgi:predicted deacylase
MTSPIKIGDIIAYPGEKKSGPCMWVELRDGTRVNLPVIIINGKHDGPKVVITAAQHPTELVGVTATQIVANRLDPEQLKGSLIIFPVANPLAMQFAQYLSPHDVTNMAAAFPGSAVTGMTPRFANFIWENAAKDADLIMDFHENWKPCLCFSIVKPSEDPAIIQKAVDLADAFGITVIKSRAGKFGLPGTAGGQGLTQLAMANGIPAFTPEFVGSTEVTFHEDDPAVKVPVRGTMNVLKKLGMISGITEPQSDILVMQGNFEAVGTIHADRGGIVHRLVDIAIKLTKDTPIAKVVNSYGESVETIVMPVDGYLWGWTYVGGSNMRAMTTQTGNAVAYCYKDA